MNKVFIFTCLILLCAVNVNGQFVQTLDVEAKETFFRFYPTNQYMQITEYSLSSLRDNEADIKEDVWNIRDLVEKANYCDERYNFDYFQSVEESMSIDRDFVRADCDLISKYPYSKGQLIDIFEKILNRDVEVKITMEDVQVTFHGEGVQIAENNAIGVYKNGDRQMIRWPNRLKYFEVVMYHSTKTAKDYKGIQDYFGFDIESPRLTEEEIKEMGTDDPYGTKRNRPNVSSAEIPDQIIIEKARKGYEFQYLPSEDQKAFAYSQFGSYG